MAHPSYKILRPEVPGEMVTVSRQDSQAVYGITSAKHTAFPAI
jgi:hypothetical protein